MLTSTLAIKNRISNAVFKFCLHLPWLGNKLQNHINQKMNSLLTEIKADICQQRSHYKILDTLPQNGLSAAEILNHFQNVNSAYNPGRSSSTVYTAYNAELNHLLKEVWGKTNLTNPLRFEWPLINLMEAEIIAMCQQLLHGEKDGPGMLTHGGSHAILEACKAYVLDARKRGIKHPNIVAPATVHIAFDKAAQILNVNLYKVVVDAKTGVANVQEMRKAINRHTCLLVGSTPCYPYGTIDPIDEFANLATQTNIPLLVDACLGGFLTMFAHEAGFENVPIYDFSLPGVDSMIIGTHKYGQTPNGNSLLLFRKKSSVSPTEVHLDWLGGLYVSPGIDGTRSGADIALTFSVLCAKGKAAYVRETQLILNLKETLWHGLKTIKEINIPFYPLLSIIVIKPKKHINTLIVAEHLRAESGWMVNILQNKKHQVIGFHFCLTAIHAYETNFCEKFITDLKAALLYAKNNPRTKLQGIAHAYPELAKGIPITVQEQMGKAYINALNSLA